MTDIFSTLMKCFGDNVSEDMIELDFSKKEDVDKLVEIVNEFKTVDNPLYKFVKNFIGIDEDMLDNLVKYAQNEYAKTHLDDKVEATPNLPAKAVPERPSDKVSANNKDSIIKLVTEYMETMVKPYTELTPEAYKNVHNGLFEFACWVMNHQ